MESKQLSTGQAAKICSVTPDTILKWIKKGRIPATRTVGGHYRIRKQDLPRTESREKGTEASDTDRQANKRMFHYCWEFNSNGGALMEECKDCVVYRTRAHRCYEVMKLAPEVGHSGFFCKKTCDECEYFNQVHKDPVNVLVVSDNEVQAATLRRGARGRPMRLEFTDCEYTCSALVETFRPDYAIIDCSLGRERSREFAANLMADPRIPYVRVVLAAREGEFPGNCDKEVFARIETPLDIRDITACIDGVREGEEVPRKNRGGTAR